MYEATDIIMYVHIMLQLAKKWLLTERQAPTKFDARLLHPVVPHTVSIALSAISKDIRSLALAGNTENALAQASFGPCSSMVAMSHGVIYNKTKQPLHKLCTIIGINFWWLNSLSLQNFQLS